MADSTHNKQLDTQAEIRRLQKELKRVTGRTWDILKKAAVDSIGQRNSYVKTYY
jgi:transposase